MSKKTLRYGNEKLYSVWNAMKQRCNNKNDEFYYCYGGKGVKVCKEWQNSFNNFCLWALENGYSKGLTIDRIDANGNYEPVNCRWVDNITQQRNRADRKRYNFLGKELLLVEISEITNIPIQTLWARAKYGRDFLSGRDRATKEFNKTVFLTREEAEAKLKEMEQ